MSDDKVTTQNDDATDRDPREGFLTKAQRTWLKKFDELSADILADPQAPV